MYSKKDGIMRPDGLLQYLTSEFDMNLPNKMMTFIDYTINKIDSEIR